MVAHLSSERTVCSGIYDGSLDEPQKQMLKFPPHELRQQAQLDRSWQRNCLRPNYRVELRYLLRRHLWILLSATLISVGGASVYIFTTPRLYTAKVQVLLDPRIPTPLPNGRDENRFSKEFDNPEIESQLEILHSPRIRQAVVKKLKLYDDPEFVDERSNSIHAIISSSIEYVSDWLSKITGPADEPQISDQASADFRAASDYLRDGLQIERVKLSYVLDISFTSTDPNTAARIANAIADTYIDDQLTTSSQIASQGAKWLEDRIDQLRRKVNEAAFKLQQFRAQRSDSVAEQTTLDELESTTSAFRRIYESYLQAYIDSAQRQALPAGIARIVNYANVPTLPSYPRKGNILLGAAVLGLLAGYSVAALRNLFDKTIRGAYQVEKAGLSYLGELRGLNESHQLRLVSEEPLSQFAYDIRRLERNLSARTAPSFRAIGLTPISPDICTSEVAFNLACLHSIAGKRVLLVDAKPSTARLTRALNASEQPGLTDIVLGSAEADECIITDAFHRVDLIPAGTAESQQTTDKPPGNRQFGDYLEPVLELYDVVVFDLPAAFTPAALTLATLVDAIVIVTKSGSTQMPLVCECASAFETGTDKFVGVVVAFGPVNPRTS